MGGLILVINFKVLNLACFVSIYVLALPGGDETMLHTVCIVVFWRMAISDIPVPICWRIHRRLYLTTVGWRICGRLYPTMVDVVSRGIPHSESVNTFHFRDLTLYEGTLIKINWVCIPYWKCPFKVIITRIYLWLPQQHLALNNNTSFYDLSASILFKNWGPSQLYYFFQLRTLSVVFFLLFRSKNARQQFWILSLTATVNATKIRLLFCCGSDSANLGSKWIWNVFIINLFTNI